MKYFKLAGVIMLMLFIVSCANIDSTLNSNSGEEDVPLNDNSANGEWPSSFVENASSESKSQTTMEKTPKDIYDRINNKIHKSQLITTAYSLESLQEKFARNGSPFHGYAFAIKEMDEKFPIECIRKVSEKHYYVVYKVKEGGYLYAHLINPYGEVWTGQNNGLELSNSYYVNGKSNIQEIKIGDSFVKVSAHDKSIIGNNFNYLMEVKNGEYCFYSVHIDSKKMFLITYDDSKTIDEIKQSYVKSISEYSKLTFSPEGFKEYNYEYNYDVLDIDL